MTIIDGQTLRSLRNNQGVPLRRIARVAGMSHGHLSKVERSELGRPVTPATRAYDPDLRAHVLADIATHYLTFNAHEDCLTVLRLAEGDERISEPVRIILKAIRHRAEQPDTGGAPPQAAG